MLRIAAILSVRNEAVHIERSLRDLVSDAINVVLIDHASTDDTVAKARAFLDSGLLAIRDLQWRGVFSLTEQLAMKRSIALELDYDWIIHIDADEQMHSMNEGESLRDAITKADAQGFNCINFNEFVFFPFLGEDFYHESYADEMINYYHFRPRHPRLMRAQKLSAGLDYGHSGGHVLMGSQLAVYPEDMALRHYIMLSHQHGRHKYLKRVFAQEEVDRGWHANRLVISEANLEVRPNPCIQTLPYPRSRALNVNYPVKKHFWEWREVAPEIRTGI